MIGAEQVTLTTVTMKVELEVATAVVVATSPLIFNIAPLSFVYYSLNIIHQTPEKLTPYKIVIEFWHNFYHS